MKQLLSSNFYCLRKSKLSLIMIILAISLPLLICLLYLGLNAIMKEATSFVEDQNVPQSLFGAREVISGTFSLSSNLGLILPIFTGIIIGADLSNGTLRNKIIVGKSKTKIYFSHLITAILFHLLIGVIHAIAMVGFGLVFFRYGIEVNGEEVRNLIYFYISGLAAFTMTASLVSAFSLLFKTPAPTILITIMACLGFGLISSLINLVDYEKFKYLVYLIPGFSNNKFTAPGGIETVVFIEGLLSYLLFSGIFITIGAVLFNKKEIK